MKRLRLLTLVGLFAMRPAAAHAEWDVLDYIAGLSGPGPFFTHPENLASNWDVRVICGRPNRSGYVFLLGDDRSCLASADDIPWYVTFQYLGLTTGNVSQFGERTPRAIDVRVVQLLFRARLAPAVDVGAGLGWMSFIDARDQPTGTFSTVHSPTLTPSLVIRPFRFASTSDWARVLSVRFEPAIRFGELRRERFGGPPGETYPTELNVRLAANIDIGVIVAHFWK